MLVVLEGAPCAAPAEATGDEQAIAEVGGVYLAGDILATVTVVGISLAFGRKDTATTDVEARVVERIHIYCHATAVPGQVLASGNMPVAEARCVVIRHGAQVRGFIIVNQAHAGYRVTNLVQLAEDIQQIFSDLAVAYHLAYVFLSIEVIVRQLEIAQF